MDVEDGIETNDFDQQQILHDNERKTLMKLNTTSPLQTSCAKHSTWFQMCDGKRFWVRRFFMKRDALAARATERSWLKSISNKKSSKKVKQSDNNSQQPGDDDDADVACSVGKLCTYTL